MVRTTRSTRGGGEGNGGGGEGDGGGGKGDGGGEGEGDGLKANQQGKTVVTHRRALALSAADTLS